MTLIGFRFALDDATHSPCTVLWSRQPALPAADTPMSRRRALRVRYRIDTTGEEVKAAWRDVPIYAALHADGTPCTTYDRQPRDGESRYVIYVAWGDDDGFEELDVNARSADGARAQAKVCLDHCYNPGWKIIGCEAKIGMYL